jgi:hypothetical protein
MTQILGHFWDKRGLFLAMTLRQSFMGRTTSLLKPRLYRYDLFR